MKILVTGARGQLGREIQSLSGKLDSEVFTFIDFQDLDLTDQEKTTAFIEVVHPDVIINCAAYTAVDLAEQEQEPAFKMNRDVPGHLALLSKQTGIKLIHFSTDYIFNGHQTRPYVESDPPDPLSVYASSKFQGESAILKHNPGGIIIRTSWLYSEYGHNFVKTILRKSEEMQEIRVIDDQIGTPTYAYDLAALVLHILPEVSRLSATDFYHYSNEGSASWYDFASSIKEISGFKSIVVPIKTADLQLPAKRPHYSILDKTLIKKDFHLEIPHWRESLEKCMRNILHS